MKILGMQSSTTLIKSLRERFFQAFLFEIIAVVLCSVVGAWLLGYSLAHMGALTVAISTVAMLWNMVFNALFDRLQNRMGFRRGVVARVLHAIGFEVGLLMAIVPMAAWWLDISLWRAFWLDIGVALFFLPYTFLYNLAYDTLRARWVQRRQSAAAAPSVATSAAPRPTR